MTGEIVEDPKARERQRLARLNELVNTWWPDLGVDHRGGGIGESVGYDLFQLLGWQQP